MQQQRDRRPGPPQPARPYPNSYGPSSTIRPQQPVSVAAQSPPINAYQAFQQGLVPTSTASPSNWHPYATPTTARGSFFVSGSGTQRLASSNAVNTNVNSSIRPRLQREPLPLPTNDARSANSQPPQFTDQTSYSPPRFPQAFPPGAMPLPNNQRPRRIQNQYQHPGAPSPPPGLPTKVPLATSSSIMVHSGFWQILQATGSRFVSGVAPAFVGGEVGFSDSSYGASGYGAHLPMPGGLGRPAVKGSMGQSTGEGGSKKGRRISVDMISNPVSFT